MQVMVEIPDAIATQLLSSGKEPGRAALEALALEGYCAHELSDAQVRRMLGYETRMEVHAFLKDHGVVLNYTLAELHRDRMATEPASSTRTEGNSR